VEAFKILNTLMSQEVNLSWVRCRFWTALSPRPKKSLDIRYLQMVFILAS
jgi:hypothetical protein